MAVILRAKRKIIDMDLLRNLFEGWPTLWGGGVAHSVLILSLVIAIGLLLGKIRVANISLGLAWVLFIGIVFGNFAFNLDEHLLHFLKEFGLILFVYSIGMQVGPGIVSSFHRGGLRLNLLAVITLIVSVVVMMCVAAASGMNVSTMAGIFSGAVTNTPGLGAAQQAYSDLRGIDAPDIAIGYAMAYPIGVLGVIACFAVLKYLLRINTKTEEAEAERGLGATEQITVRHFTIRFTNDRLAGRPLREVAALVSREFVISRILPNGADKPVNSVDGNTLLNIGDKMLITAKPSDIDPIVAAMGEEAEVDWHACDKQHVVGQVIITKPGINGKTIAQLAIRTQYGVNITRVYRSGVELVATPHLRLQMGDRLTVVGNELGLSQVEKKLGNQMKMLNVPNLIPIFLGIALGCVLANIPFYLPGIEQPLKLGLTGGPLIVAILIGYFGPKYKLITYNTISANLMIREIGICIFLACVGLGCGKDFVSTLANAEGLSWIGYGALITVIPILIGGLIGRWCFHLNFYTILGVLAGTNTNPPALHYANGTTSSDAPSVAYSMVYPFAMFLRIITIQIIIFALA